VISLIRVRVRNFQLIPELGITAKNMKTKEGIYPIATNPQVDIQSNPVVNNPPKATKIFLGESGENLNYIHTVKLHSFLNFYLFFIFSHLLSF